MPDLSPLRKRRFGTSSRLLVGSSLLVGNRRTTGGCLLFGGRSLFSSSLQFGGLFLPNLHRLEGVGIGQSVCEEDAIEVIDLVLENAGQIAL